MVKKTTAAAAVHHRLQAAKPAPRPPTAAPAANDRRRQNTRASAESSVNWTILIAWANYRSTLGRTKTTASCGSADCAHKHTMLVQVVTLPLCLCLKMDHLVQCSRFQSREKHFNCKVGNLQNELAPFLSPFFALP